MIEASLSQLTQTNVNRQIQLAALFRELVLAKGVGLFMLSL